MDWTEAKEARVAVMSHPSHYVLRATLKSFSGHHLGIEVLTMDKETRYLPIKIKTRKALEQFLADLDKRATQCNRECHANTPPAREASE